MSESSSPNGSARERQIAWAHRKRSREKASAGKVSRSAANVDASVAVRRIRQIATRVAPFWDGRDTVGPTNVRLVRLILRDELGRVELVVS